MTAFCGIDFGTSNSTVSLAGPTGPARLIALEGGHLTLPSAVFWPEDGVLSFGRAAIADYVEGEEGRLMRGLKSTLGLGLIDERTAIGGRGVTFREVLSRFIGHLRACLDAQATGVTKVVLGRPVHFVDDDPAADAAAEAALAAIARAVGFTEIAFQFEPIAAALRYEEGIAAEELVLIVDIGGGTSDFSLVRLSPERRLRAERQSDILATGGIHIGGTDFDRVLSLDCVMPMLGYRSRLRNGATMPASVYFQLAAWHTINFAYTRQAWADLQQVYRDALARTELDRLCRLINLREGHWLAMQVEEAKIALSAAERTQVALDRIEPGLVLDLSRAAFATATQGLVERVGGCVAGLLAASGVDRERIDTLYFTGGASGVPQLRARIAAELPRARSVEGDLYGSIGAGLAVEAARRYG